MNKPIVCALLILAGVFFAGCQREAAPPSPPAADPAIEQRHAIEGYVGAIPAVEELQRAFQVALASAMSTCQDACDVAEHARGFRAKVLPAFHAYHDALRTMPTGSPELSEIHGGIVRAYRDNGARLEAYAEGLTRKNLVNRRVAYINSLLAVTSAEELYQSELRAYFESVPNVIYTPEQAAQPSAR